MRTLRDVMISAVNYYKLSGGRVLAHGMTFCVLLAKPWIFEVVNAGMFVILGLFVYWLVPNKGWREHAFSLPLVYFSIFYFSLSFGDSAVWLSGSVNYLWTGVLNLLTIFFFRRYAAEKPCGIRHLILIALFMFLAGQSNETTGGMLLILLALYGLLHYEETKREWRPYAAAVPAVLCGMAVVLLAPGNRNRANVIHDVESPSLSGIKDCILTYFIDLLSQTWPIMVLCLFVFLMQAQKGKWIQAFCGQRFLWAGIAGTAALGMAGIVIPRGSFLPVIYVILAGCESAEYLISRVRSINREERWNEVLAKSRLRGIVLRVIAAIFCVELVSMLSIMLRGLSEFSENDLLFLTRGLGFMALAAVVLILPDKQFWMEKISRYGKKILVLGILIFGIFYFAENMRAFQINKEMQRTMEEQARKSAAAREGEPAAVGFPLFQLSDFWPRESGCSHEYTAAWMKEYFQYEEGGR